MTPTGARRATRGVISLLGGGTLTFAVGDTSKTVSVSLNDDALDEHDEVLAVTLSCPSGAKLSDTAASATATITDDDALPSVSLSGDASAAEGDPVEFEVRLSAVSGRDVTVAVSTALVSDGDEDTRAVAADFTAQAATVVTVPAGDTTATASVPTADNETAGPNKRFSLTVSSPTNATLSATATDLTKTGTINDDEPRISIRAELSGFLEHLRRGVGRSRRRFGGHGVGHGGAEPCRCVRCDRGVGHQ